MRPAVNHSLKASVLQHVRATPVLFGLTKQQEEEVLKNTSNIDLFVEPPLNMSDPSAKLELLKTFYDLFDVGNLKHIDPTIYIRYFFNPEGKVNEASAAIWASDKQSKVDKQSLEYGDFSAKASKVNEEK